MGLDGVELVMAVEEEFQIAISDSEASDCTTVRKLVELVNSRLRHDSKDPCPSGKARGVKSPKIKYCGTLR